MAGIDEAGRGCLAGPVVASAVILPPGIQFEGLNDSKKTKKVLRDSLRTEISSKSLAWVVAFADPREIDQANILQATYLAMHRCLDFLISGNMQSVWGGKRGALPEKVWVDGNRFKPYQNLPYQCEIQGDGRFASIASASILAKTFRDEWMQKIHHEFPEYGWDKNMGYGTAQHRKKIHDSGLTPYHRRSFHLKKHIQTELF